MTLKVVDLFAGTGAFTLAFQQVGGVETVLANDQDKHSKQIYDANFDHPLLLGDITQLDPTTTIPPHDILTAGFPCQPFSVAGNKMGFGDPRANVFWSIIKILKHHQPDAIVLENVRNLLTHDGGNTFKIILGELEGCGYHVRWKVLNTSKITGIPQNRERLYIVGFRRKDLYDQLSLDFPLLPKRPLAEFWEPDVEAKYSYPHSSILTSNVVNENTVYQLRRIYVRENKSGECPTLTANMGTGGNNVPIIRGTGGVPRKLTPRECFRLQGFPDSYTIPPMANSHLYKLAGNAVSVPVARLVAGRVVGLLAPTNISSNVPL